MHGHLFPHIQFNRVKQSSGKSALLTDAQQEWLLVQRMMASTQPEAKFKPPIGSPIRLWVFNWVVTRGWVVCYLLFGIHNDLHQCFFPPSFDNVMIVIIVSNTVAMCCVHSGMSRQWITALSVTNAVFTGIFIIEMMLKWVALGFSVYFKVSS